MRKFCIAALGILCLAQGALAADTNAHSVRRDLLDFLMADLGITEKQRNVVSGDHPLDKWLTTLLVSHARQFGRDRERLQIVGDRLAKQHIVLVDGRMASAVYQEALTVERSLLPVFRGFELDAWQAASPTSAQPLIANAQARIDRAAGDWRVAYFRSNTTEGHTPNATELADVTRYLHVNKAVMGQDPIWHNLMVEVAVYRGAPEAEIKSLVREGLAAFPGNTQLAVEASAHYLPKWNGDPSKLASYAAWVMTLPRMSDRHDIYPRIYAHALYRQYQLTLFKLVAKDWGLLQQGIRHMLATYPANSNRNTAALLACLAGDRDLTREILQSPAFRLETGLWLDKDAPGLCGEWVLQKAPNRSRT